MASMSQEIDYLHLPRGTIIANKYEIKGKLVPRSNLSIIYLALDLTTKEKVVIKEFFPQNLVLRDLDAKTVVPKNSRDENLFAEEKDSFLTEGKIMQKLTGRCIAKCYQFFKENNTAYLVLEYYRGQNLAQYLAEEDVDWQQFLDQIFLPLLKTVEKMHQQGYIHRDIKPANIIYGDRLKLIDFGSAIKWQKNEYKKRVLTPGYSPLEFYSTRTKQGPSSDVYSLAAILYFYLTGKIPLAANQRIIEDNLAPIVEFNPRVAKGLNDFIMENLSLDFSKREETVEKFRLNLEFECIKIKSKKILKTFVSNLLRLG